MAKSKITGQRIWHLNELSKHLDKGHLSEPEIVTTVYSLGLESPTKMGEMAKQNSTRPILKIKLTGSINNGITFNKTIIKKYIDELGEISDFDNSQILKAVLNLPNTIDKEEQTISDNQLDKILTALNLVVSDVKSHRKNEGINTKNDVLKNINTIESHIKKVEKYSEAHKKTIKEDLETKAQNLNIENDYGRFEQELLYYLEKMDINEELVRLKSHINFFIETLDNAQDEKGKKLGFISQEIGREINTVGSKCNNSKIQNHVVEMKSSLEKIREQSLNLL